MATLLLSKVHGKDQQAFLPMNLWGTNVLVHTHGNTWRVDNSVVQHPGEGLAYRWSKRMDDKLGAFARWGSIVEGTDTGDGWLQLQGINGKASTQQVSLPPSPPTIFEQVSVDTHLSASAICEQFVDVRVINALSGMPYCTLTTITVNTTVLQLKSAIEGKLNIPSFEQQLLGNASILSDATVLNSLVDPQDGELEISLLWMTSKFFRVLLERAPEATTRLGCKVMPEGTGTFLVCSIEADAGGSLIRTWNQKVDEAQQVHVGDTIVTINDVGGDHRAMEAAVQDPGMLELTVVQGNARKRSAGYVTNKNGRMRSGNLIDL